MNFFLFRKWKRNDNVYRVGAINIYKVHCLYQTFSIGTDFHDKNTICNVNRFSYPHSAFFCFVSIETELKYILLTMFIMVLVCIKFIVLKGFLYIHLSDCMRVHIFMIKIYLFRTFNDYFMIFCFRIRLY